MSPTDHINLNEKKGFSNVINATFHIASKHFKLLTMLFVTYSAIPVIILGIVGASINNQNITQYVKMIMSGEVVNTPPQVGAISLMSIVSIIAYTFISGLVFEFLSIYKTSNNEPIRIDAIWKKFLNDLPAFLTFQLITILIFGAGAVILVLIASMFVVSQLVFLVVLFIIGIIIAIVYLMIPLSMMLMVRTEEKADYFTTWKRCFQLVKTNWWLTFGIIVIMSLIQSIMASVFALPQLVYAIVTGISTIQQHDPTLFNNTLLSFFGVISTIGSSWLSMIVYLAIGIHYYSLVEKKDNNSILNRIDQIGESTSNS